MRTLGRSTRVAAAGFGLVLIAASCGDDGGSGGAASTLGSVPATTGTTTTPDSTPSGSGATTTPGTSAGSTPGTGGAGTGMTLTIKIKKDANWDDGTPITSKDLECVWKATLKTPGSLSTVGYDKITAIDTSDPKTAVVTFSEPYAAYRNLFAGLMESSKLQNCEDVSADMQDSYGFSGREWKLDSFSKDQITFSPNATYLDKDAAPKAKKVVFVPRTDDGGIAALKAGEVDMIFPQAYAGINEALNDPNIKATPGYGTNYEGLYFQQKSGPFSDDVFRKAFAMSIDRDLILKNIYEPIFPGSKLLNCGLWVPTIGKWCDDSIFADYYKPDDAAKMLTDAGWAKNGDGLWAKGGTAPTIRWMVNSGNKRREDTQALMIPEFKKAGFNVVADNADAATVFQKRMPALDYDLAMYINTSAPDPTVTGIMSCSQVPSEENNNQGQNTVGWCNEEASALMTKSDQELDESKRIDQIHQIGTYLADDAVMLSLYQFPNIVAWRTDKLDGPVDSDAANYMGAFHSMNEWTPKSGDQITIGAEQWPDCINPITECANSSWMVWMTTFRALPNVWDTTNDGGYETTGIVDGEPEVKVG